MVFFNYDKLFQKSYIKDTRVSNLQSIQPTFVEIWSYSLPITYICNDRNDLIFEEGTAQGGKQKKKKKKK